MRNEDIYAKVASTVAETLSIEKRQIKPWSKLQADLGAESIDIVDLLFRLESEFGIDIPESDFYPAGLIQQHPEYVQNGQVTERGLAALQDRLPYLDLGAFAQNPEKSAINDLFTVESVARYVETRLRDVSAAEAEDGEVCGQEAVGIWTSFI
jgi:acyl carrier protein